MDLFLARRNLLLGPASQQAEPKLAPQEPASETLKRDPFPDSFFPLYCHSSLVSFLVPSSSHSAPLPDLRLISSFRCSFAFSSLPLCSISPIEFGCHHRFSFFAVGKKRTAEEYHETPDANGWEEGASEEEDYVVLE